MPGQFGTPTVAEMNAMRRDRDERMVDSTLDAANDREALRIATEQLQRTVDSLDALAAQVAVDAIPEAVADSIIEKVEQIGTDAGLALGEAQGLRNPTGEQQDIERYGHRAAWRD